MNVLLLIVLVLVLFAYVNYQRNKHYSNYVKRKEDDQRSFQNKRGFK